MSEIKVVRDLVCRTVVGSLSDYLLSVTKRSAIQQSLIKAIIQMH